MARRSGKKASQPPPRSRRGSGGGDERLVPCSELGCVKRFRRHRDLGRHQKTVHPRAWKCPVSACEDKPAGWPTERERDAHVDRAHGTAHGPDGGLRTEVPWPTPACLIAGRRLPRPHGAGDAIHWTISRDSTAGGEVRQARILAQYSQSESKPAWPRLGLVSRRPPQPHSPTLGMVIRTVPPGSPRPRVFRPASLSLLAPPSTASSSGSRANHGTSAGFYSGAWTARW